MSLNKKLIIIQIIVSATLLSALIIVFSNGKMAYVYPLMALGFVLLIIQSRIQGKIKRAQKSNQ
ncbi:hypothetical protein [Halobacillus sp. KGW1]|uniref:hypothetical protein n=1 Tax=Halobacillus sp. KGW1 TaxID=1793726 RepID=UPI000785E307|nr:hypothetical protein [Halobacillus sp. KGW1]